MTIQVPTRKLVRQIHAGQMAVHPKEIDSKLTRYGKLVINGMGWNQISNLIARHRKQGRVVHSHKLGYGQFFVWTDFTGK